MRAGETASYNGMQVALLPFDWVHLSQASGPGTYSHRAGHPADWSFYESVHPVYAPFDCHEISAYDRYAGRTFASDGLVWTPSGARHVTFRVVHDASPMAGIRFQQGQVIAHSGIATDPSLPPPTGDHCHLDQSLVQDAGLVSYGTGYALNGSEWTYNVFFLTGNEQIDNLTADGITFAFQLWQGAVPGPSPSARGKTPFWMLMPNPMNRS